MAREGTLTLTFDFLAFLTNSVLTGNHKGRDLTNLKINNLIQLPKTWTNKQGNESLSLRDGIFFLFFFFLVGYVEERPW